MIENPGYLSVYDGITDTEPDTWSDDVPLRHSLLITLQVR